MQPNLILLIWQIRIYVFIIGHIKRIIKTKSKKRDKNVYFINTKTVKTISI